MIRTRDFLNMVGKTVKLNMSLTLPGTVKRQAIEESKSISGEFDTYFVLGQWKNIPHVTLCSIEFPIEKTGEVYGIVGRIAKKFVAVRCVPTKVKEHQGYLGIQLEKTTAILGLHTELLTSLAPLRLRSEDEGSHYRMSLSDAQLRYIVDYGYPDAFELFSPHFTITRIRHESEGDAVVKRLNWIPKPFKSSFVGIYSVGDHGTCASEVMEFPLIG